jgi:hypothetical protein
MLGAGATAEDVKSCEQALAALCGEFDPDSIALSDAVAVYESAARMEKLTAGLKLRMAARAEESKAWRHAGFRSPAEWLARVSGTSTGAAHAELAASERLGELPGTADALSQGELSTVQATAIADAASVDPGAEERLVTKAKRASVRELRDECARTKAAADPDAYARYERIHRERRVRAFTDHEGAWNLHARGPAHLGAQVEAAVNALTDQLFRQAQGEGRQEPREAYAFDALVALAGQSGAGRAHLKYRALVRVDLEALTRGATGARSGARSPASVPSRFRSPARCSARRS